MPSSRIRQAGIGIVILAGALAVGWIVAAPWLHAARSAAREREAREALRRTVEARWAPAPFVELDSTDDPAIAKIIDGSIIEAPDDRLSAHQRERLVDLLVRHARARSARALEPYLRLIRNEDAGTRWITPSDRAQRAPIEGWFRWKGRPISENDDPSRLFMDFAAEQLTTGRARFAAVGSGDAGVRVFVLRAPSYDRALDALSGKLGGTGVAYWYDPPAVGAMCFRVARRSLDRVLVEEQSATFAAANVLVRLDSGAAINWHTVWFWDSGSDDWQCQVMARKGWDGLLFY